MIWIFENFQRHVQVESGYNETPCPLPSCGKYRLTTSLVSSGPSPNTAPPQRYFETKTSHYFSGSQAPCALATPGGPVRTRAATPHTQGFRVSRSQVGARVFISYRSPDDADASDPRATFWEPFYCFICIYLFFKRAPLFKTQSQCCQYSRTSIIPWYHVFPVVLSVVLLIACLKGAQTRSVLCNWLILSL